MTSQNDPPKWHSNLSTLGAQADTGTPVTAYCNTRECGHSAELDIPALAEKLGRDHGAMHWDLVPLLRCSKCGGKSIGLRMGTPKNWKGMHSS
jgi:hypothetical protein